MEEDLDIDDEEEEEFKKRLKCVLISFGLPVLAGGFRQSAFEAWFSWIILKGLKSLVILYAGVFSLGYCTFVLSRIARYIVLKEERKGFGALVREVTPDVYIRRFANRVAKTLAERAAESDEDRDTETDTELPLNSFLSQQDGQTTEIDSSKECDDDDDDDDDGDDDDDDCDCDDYVGDDEYSDDERHHDDDYDYGEEYDGDDEYSDEDCSVQDGERCETFSLETRTTKIYYVDLFDDELYDSDESWTSSTDSSESDSCTNTYSSDERPTFTRPRQK